MQWHNIHAFLPKHKESMWLSIFPLTGKTKQRGLILLEQGHCRHQHIDWHILCLALNQFTSPEWQILRKFMHEWLPLQDHYHVYSASTDLLYPARDTWKLLTTFLHAHNKAAATSSLTCMTTLSTTLKTMQAAISTPYHPHVTPPSITCFTQLLSGINLSWMDPNSTIDDFQQDGQHNCIIPFTLQSMNK